MEYIWIVLLVLIFYKLFGRKIIAFLRERREIRRLVAGILEEEFAVMEQAGDRVKLKTGAIRRKIVFGSFGAACLAASCVGLWKFAFWILVAGFILLFEMDDVYAVWKLAKKNPNTLISEIVRTDCVTKTGKCSKIPGWKRQRWIVLFSGILVCICFVFVWAGVEETEVVYEEYKDGYRLVDYDQAYFDPTNEFEIPSEYNGKAVVAIGDRAFYDNDQLKKIIVPDTVVEMGSAVFRDCDDLKTVKMSENLEVMGGACFQECSELESIVLPDSLKVLRGETFKDCESLVSVVLPKNITEIKGNTFEGCESLERIDIPKGVTRIAAHAFRECESLSEVVMSPSILEIGSSAFRECKNLYTITIPYDVEINERAFKGSPTKIEYEDRKEIITPEEMAEIEKILEGIDETEKVQGIYLYYVYENGERVPYDWPKKKIVVSRGDYYPAEEYALFTTKRDVVEYLLKGKALGKVSVLCLLPPENVTNVKGASYELEDVLDGYIAGTWNFDDAEEVHAKEERQLEYTRTYDTPYTSYTPYIPSTPYTPYINLP